MTLDKNRVLRQAKMETVPGPFTEDDIAGLTSQDTAFVVNYLINKQAVRSEGDNKRAVVRLVLSVAVVALALGAVAENVRSSLFSRPIVRSMDALTEQLREASAASRLLERLEEKK